MPTLNLLLLLLSELEVWIVQHFVAILGIGVVVCIAVGGAIVRALFNLSADMKVLQKTVDSTNAQMVAHIDDTTMHVTEREMDNLKESIRDMDTRHHGQMIEMDRKLDRIIEKL